MFSAATKTAAAAAGGYQISRSLRFNSADSAYLNRTPASAGNRRTWTWSGWIKRSAVGDNTRRMVFGGGFTNNGVDVVYLEFKDGDQIRFAAWNGSSEPFSLITTAVYRDPSSWYHVVVAFDTTQATSTNRVKLYVNGVEVTAFGTANYPTLNYDGGVNSTQAQNIGRDVNNATLYFSGYMTEINLIDGQALTPSSFGETNTQTGVWQPKAYSGSYGTNGFYLNFSDNSNTTAATLGKDYSGNGNNWTPNNFSVTAGVGNDSLVDTPTPYGSDSGAGGEVRGNYSTWNPLRNAATLANGNLDISGSSNGVNTFATVGVSNGKWYWEVTVTSVQNTYYPGIGVNTNLSLAPSSQSGADAAGYMYLANGQKFNSNSTTSYGASFTANDVIGVALDMDAGTITFYKNGSSQGQAFSGITGTAVPVVISWTSSTCVGNFGQRPFAYTAPSGFKALCTQNLPTPAIGATSTTLADDYFNTVLWTGNGASSRAITGVGFQPDWVWDKMRSGAYQHAIVDSVRGGNRVLHSNSTAAEDVNWQYGYVSSFDSDGFTIQAGSTSSENWNLNNETFVAWCWKANGAGSTNTAGSITSTVSANTTSGFSIVSYTGGGSAATVGHGLGVTPSMIIVKNRSIVQNWAVYHRSIGNTGALLLESSAVVSTFSTYWNNTSPTSSVFTVGSWNGVSGSGNSIIAYCFAEVPGFSAFGSYTGNGSTDGPFVFTDFRPAYVMIKSSSGTTGNWILYDNKRGAYNLNGQKLGANLAAEENNTAELGDSSIGLDFLSNGFKIRNTTGPNHNTNGATYIFAAFAESPFKYSLAR